MNSTPRISNLVPVDARGNQSGGQSDGFAGRAFSEPPADSIDLGMIWLTIWRGKWIVMLSTLILAAFGAFYALNMTTNLYRAQTTLIMTQQQTQIVDLPGVVGGLGGDLQTINSQVEVLQARGLLGEVVDQLDLTNVPEFNPRLEEPSAFSALMDSVQASVRSVFTQGEATGGGGSGRTAEEDAILVRNVAIDRLKRRVFIDNLPLTFILEISAETENRARSAAIVDTLAEAYIQDQVDVKFQASERATTWLTGRVSDLQVQLEEAEGRVSQFNSSTDLISVEVLQAQEIQLKDLRDRIEETREANASARERLAQLRAAETRAEQAQIAQDPQLNQFLARIDQPTIAAAFDTRFQQIIQRTELDIARNEQQLTALEQSAVDQQRQIDVQSEDLIQLQQLTREAEAIRLLYEYFLTRLNETAAQEGIQSPDSRVLSAAVLPRGAVSPNRPLIVTIAAILGALLGLAYVLFVDARRKGVRTSRELEALTGHVVLGQIPQIPRRKRKKILEYLAQNPTSAAVEAVRNLRTSVMLSSPKEPQVIVTTSSLPGEGKTTNALALAQNMVGMGKKVLLVEGDIRRMTFTEYFDDLPEAGLASVLDGRVSLSEAVYREPLLGADILSGEKTDTNAADVFSSNEFGQFIADARHEYDAIIIDTPPVLVVPDARIIAQHADALLIVVRWDHTSRTQIEETMHMFHTARRKVTGLVLSQINARRMKAYGYGETYGAYAKYGAKYYAK